ncbi:MAG: RNA polymerase sporulation sigma factor SigH [Lachnospiraceae bacterium]|nr:RNA polymerase sporulation sigma factor SigH [Lachnospiraceae bacterium]
MRMKNYEAETDESLVELINDGDSEAMDYLMNKYKNLVRGRARTLFLVGADKEDLIQEGMIGLYKAIRDYDVLKNVSFRNFAELCISRQMYSAIKGSNTQKNQPLNNYISIDSMEVSEDRENPMEQLMGINFEKNKNPEQLVLDKEAASVLEYTLVGHLSEMEKQVLHFYMKDMNYSQIAAALGKEPKAVDNALQRIKKKLTQVLAELK